MLVNPNPLVSCICPITASRQKYLPILFRSFLGQKHDRKELILISEDEIDFPAHPQIRLVKCDPGLTVGAKRNIGAANANGEVVVHFDSDDFSRPGRIEEQLRLMRQCERPVVGYNSILFYNQNRNEAYKLRPGPSSWAAGTSLMYTKSYWQANNFEDRSVGEDSAFVGDAARQNAVIGVDGRDMIVALDHDTNTSPRSGDGQTHEYCPWYYLPLSDVDSVRRLIFPKPNKIALSLLSWNLKDVLLENVQALRDEAKRLYIAGYEVEIIVADNGSTDGTQVELKKRKADLTLILNKKNLGSSVARNQIIDRAIKGGADYLTFLDGDVTCVPWSIVSMLPWMERDSDISCFGAYWYGYSGDPSKCSPHATKVEPKVTTEIMCSQYGILRRELFETVRFDENFGPGWSAEDNDFFLQMTDLGFKSFVTDDFIYLHRDAHHGHFNHADGDEQFYKRTKYMVEKWSDKPRHKAYLDNVARCKPPVKETR